MDRKNTFQQASRLAFQSLQGNTDIFFSKNTLYIYKKRVLTDFNVIFMYFDLTSNDSAIFSGLNLLSA